MNIKYYVLLLIVCAVTSIGIVDAAMNDRAKISVSKHVKNDNIERATQVFNLTSVEKGSKINSANATFTLDSFIGDQCVLILNESHLNKDKISDVFTCQSTNNVEIQVNGLHALETKLGNGKYNIIVKSIITGNTIPIISSDINLDISYLSPTYFAQITDGVVTNIIVADQKFIDTLDGQWIETKHINSIRGKYAGIGDTYDSIRDKFIPPQPYQSWFLNNQDIWVPPTPYPSDGLRYYWNESNQEWVLFE